MELHRGTSRGNQGLKTNMYVYICRKSIKMPKHDCEQHDYPKRSSITAQLLHSAVQI